MEHATRKPGDGKEIPAFGPDSIEAGMRPRIRKTIQALVEEELEAALGAPSPPESASGGRATVTVVGSGR